MSNIVTYSISQKVTNNGKNISDYTFNSFPQIIEADNVTSVMTIAKMAVSNEKTYEAVNFQFQTFNGISLECSDVVEVRFAETIGGLITATPVRVKGELIITNGLGYAVVSITNIGISGNECRIAFHGTMVM